MPTRAQITAETPNGISVVAAASFTRPANTTAYTAGDLVANSTTASEVTGLVFSNAVRNDGAGFRIERLRLTKSGTSLTNASFRVYLFRALPVSSAGDNAAFNTSGALSIDNIQYLVGWFDITMDRSATIGARGIGIPNVGPAISTVPVSGSTALYALIEATAAYTPTSGETFEATLEGQWA